MNYPPAKAGGFSAPSKIKNPALSGIYVIYDVSKNETNLYS